MGYPDGERPPGPDEVVRMSEDAVEAVRRRFRGVAQVLYNSSEDLPDAYSTLGTAVGSFHTQIDDGLTPFTASWQATFGICSDEARLIAGNTNRLAVDLDRLDQGSA